MQNKIPYSFWGAQPPRPPASEIQFQDKPLPSENPRSAPGMVLLMYTCRVNISLITNQM